MRWIANASRRSCAFAAVLMAIALVLSAGAGSSGGLLGPLWRCDMADALVSACPCEQGIWMMEAVSDSGRL